MLKTSINSKVTHFYQCMTLYDLFLTLVKDKIKMSTNFLKLPSDLCSIIVNRISNISQWKSEGSTLKIRSRGHAIQNCRENFNFFFVNGAWMFWKVFSHFSKTAA